MATDPFPVVLVIDDDPDIRALIEDLLSPDEYRVVSAEHGAAALRLIAREQPDVILLDVNMPIMDGPAFIRAYRETAPPHAPIICMTAGHNAAQRSREIGADTHLGKPFEVPDLYDAIARSVPRAA
ncbi:MAG TPA: response regulator [Chloroflexota bacterium]|nr:response regulator [Chloroflexota bacterium]